MKAPALSRFATRRMIIASVVFLLAIAVTLLAWYAIQLSLRASSVRAFEEHAARIDRVIQDRMRGYEQVLRSGAGLFAASTNVTRDEWRRYVETTHVREIYPGVRGMHYAMRVSPAGLAAHIAEVHREGFAGYAVRPEGAREEYFPIAWVEPMDERNRSVMGFDVFSEPVRRDAMTLARDSGKPVISGKVTLAGDAAAAVPGFVFYIPIYARNLPVETVEQRRSALTGFIFCPFRMQDLMDGLLGVERDVLALEIYDGVTPSEAGLMFDDNSVRQAALVEGDRKGPWVMHQLRFGEHAWTTYYEASPGFMATMERSTPRWLLLAGLLISAIVTLMIWRLLTSEAIALTASLHDGLTGLYNRRFLEASLKREESRARRGKGKVSIVQFDLDSFKKLNDDFGHAAGDEVLRCVSEVLRSATRGEDIVCRYGGEEFTLILPGASLAHAEARAIKIGRLVSKLNVSSAGQALPRITLSGGVAVFPEDGNTLQDVLRRADHALLRAKREGRARILIARPDDPTTSQFS
ncbi:MAG: CHASE domain-containing protein [Betaproteobacteria bacterium]